MPILHPINDEWSLHFMFFSIYLVLPNSRYYWVGSIGRNDKPVSLNSGEDCTIKYITIGGMLSDRFGAAVFRKEYNL
jgi:hypothetical protein